MTPTINFEDDDTTQTLSLLSGSGSPAFQISGSRNNLTLLAANLGGTEGAPAVILSGADNYLLLRISTLNSTGAIALQGSAFADTVISFSSTIRGKVDLGAGDDYFGNNVDAVVGDVHGGDGNDTLINSGGRNALRFFGDAGNDGLVGGNSNDTLDGGADDDMLFGTGGDDILIGGAGADVLEGGPGNDTLTGDADDVAVFTALWRDSVVTMAGGNGTVVAPLGRTDDLGTDTLSGIFILVFDDQRVDTRIARNELVLTATGSTFTNTQARYGAFAVDLQGAGSTFINQAVITGIGTAHSVRLANGSSTSGAHAALAISADGVTVENRLGATISGIGNALSTAAQIRSTEGGGITSFRSGNNLQVVNNGLITSSEGEAVRSGSDFILINGATGVIDGKLAGVATSIAVITNAGVIRGGIRSFDLELTNTGTIEGEISTASYFSLVTNSGTMTGGYRAYGGMNLVNTGTSSGNFTVDVTPLGQINNAGFTYVGFDNRNSFSGDIAISGAAQFLTVPPERAVYTAQITNSGSFTGNIISTPTLATRTDGVIPDAVFVERIVNTGTITGNLSLGTGPDSVENSGRITGTVDLGSGDDVFSLKGTAAAPQLINANGGEGFDTLVVEGTPGEFNGSYYVRHPTSFQPLAMNFERLEFINASGDMFGFSGFQQISIVSTGGSIFTSRVNLFGSINPLADVQMDAGSLIIGDTSSVRNVAGSDRSEYLEMFASGGTSTGLLGSALLGGGNDQFTLYTFGNPTSSVNIGGTVDGGAGFDTLTIEGDSEATLDLGIFSNFERLDTGIFSSATSSLRLSNARNLLEIAGDSDGRLTLAQSKLPNAAVMVAARGTLILEATTTIGRYGFPDHINTMFDQVQLADDRQSVTVINNGTILGAVQLFHGDDLYDGRLGTTGGTIFGYAGNDRLFGGAGNDRIDGGFGSDDLFGEGGNDRLNGGPGGDRLDGGDGFDYVSYVAATAGVLADLVVWTLNSGEAAGDVYANIEGILGSALGDDLRGTGGNNWIYGGAGADIAYGRGGNDVLIGEAGDDTLWGNDGNDELYGGEGLDRLLGGAGADLLNGEGGFDFAHYDDATSGLTVDLASNALNAGGALGDQLFNVEGVVGSFFNDRLLGDGITNWLYGVDGSDVIDGRGGDDVLIAGNGDDVVFGGDGNDLMFGEIGDDLLLGGAGNDRMDGGAGNDTLTGGAGADVLIGNLGFDYVAYEGAAAGVTADLVAWGNNSGEAAGDSLIEVEGIIGSSFNDSLRGDAGANFLYGLAGADFIYGRGGNDVLIGGDGDDTLFGNEGDDAIYGGAGNDRIVFGAGDGRDAIFEFEAGAGVGDVIQLAASLGISSFTQLQGRMTQFGADTLISFDTNTAIAIIGVAPGALAANDFIFG